MTIRGKANSRIVSECCCVGMVLCWNVVVLEWRCVGMALCRNGAIQGDEQSDDPYKSTTLPSVHFTLVSTQLPVSVS